MGPLAGAAVVLAVLAAAACGAGSTTVGTVGQPRLTITYWPHGRDGESTTATLTCDPNGGDHPRPAQACAALADHPEALHPVPLDMACTQIYGGDQVALIEGTGPGGIPVRAVLNRTDGCQIARWDALAPVLEVSG